MNYNDLFKKAKELDKQQPKRGYCEYLLMWGLLDTITDEKHEISEQEFKDLLDMVEGYSNCCPHVAISDIVDALIILLNVGYTVDEIKKDYHDDATLIAGELCKM